MTAYCWLAISGLAFFRTKLYAARLGPTETSYHDMNQNPGTLIFMLSCHSPPLYHAGSFGSRLIIAPPVETGILSAKMPRGPPTSLMMSMTGRCLSASAQFTGGICGARSNILDARINSSCDVFDGNIGRTWFCWP